MKNVTTTVFGDGSKRSCQQVLIDAMEECESYEQIVIVVRDKDSDVRIGFSTGRYTDHIGMLTFAAQEIGNDLRDNTE